jgi:hypothetical protein
MGFPFSVRGIVSWPKTPNDTRSVEDVCAQIEEMLKAIKAKTITRSKATVSYTPGLYPVGAKWKLPIGIDHGKFIVEDAGAEWRIRYFGSMVRFMMFVTLLEFIWMAWLFSRATHAATGWSEHPIAVPVLVWLWLWGGNYLFAGVRFSNWLRRGVQRTN